MTAIRFMHEWPTGDVEIGRAGIVQCTHCGVRTSGFIADHGMVPACSPDAAACEAGGQHSIHFATSPESMARYHRDGVFTGECLHCQRQWIEANAIRLPTTDMGARGATLAGHGERWRVDGDDGERVCRGRRRPVRAPGAPADEPVGDHPMRG